MSRTSMFNWCEISQIPILDLIQGKKLCLLFRVKPYTLLSFKRLSKLYDLVTGLNRAEILGDLVECGVWNGGSAGIIGKANRSNRGRELWLFDSWEGLPEPGAMDISFRGESGVKGDANGNENRVRELLFQKLRLDCHRTHLIKGWYENTVASTKSRINLIALLHIDCDWYASVKLALDELYDQVTPGGFIVIDDFGYWTGCRVATEEFIANRHLPARLVKIDSTAVYFEKPFH